MERISMIAAAINGLLAFAVCGQISEDEILALLERQELATARMRIEQAYRQ